MAMSEKTRNAIYQGLEPLISEEAIGEMLSYFPARDVEEAVTKEHLDRRIAELRGEMTTGFAKLEASIAHDRWVLLVWLIAAIWSAVGVVLFVLPHLVR